MDSVTTLQGERANDGPIIGFFRHCSTLPVMQLTVYPADLSQRNISIKRHYNTSKSPLSRHLELPRWHVSLRIMWANDNVAELLSLFKT